MPRLLNPVTDPHFLLHTDASRELYAAASLEPIYDYHTHLPPDEIADNRQWENLTEVWLGGDHYKWRAMRANGIPESHITGNAAPYEKFLAFAKTMPRLIRNPLWHWTHLELDRIFGIHTTLDENSASRIWDEANEQLQSISAQSLLKQFRVAMVGTTDDPCDELTHHTRIREKTITTNVYPAFRPDKVLAAHQPESLKQWVRKLEDISGINCDSLDGLLRAIRARHTYFHDMHSRLSDHGINHAFHRVGTFAEAENAYASVQRGQPVVGDALAAYQSFLMIAFGEMDAEQGWVKQLHLGALRNPNTKAFDQLGPDSGFDSIGDFSQIDGLTGYLDALEQREKLPKMVLYNINPRDNYAIAALCGSFQGEGVRGKIQFGSGWWFLDQLDGMRWQMNALSQIGLLSNFIGMLTDSRSFLSFPRHEYFRRLLCDIVGNDVEQGLIPADMSTLKQLIKDISYRNATNFFDMPGSNI